LRHSTFYILINAINLIWDGKKTKKIIWGKYWIIYWQKLNFKLERRKW
jgi:hypothetical protein